MDKLLAFTVGIVVGVLAVQWYARTPQGGRTVAAVTGTADEFVRAVSDSYRARRAEGVRP